MSLSKGCCYNSGTFFEIEESQGGGSRGSIKPLTLGIGSSIRGSSLLLTTSSFFLVLERSLTFLREKPSSKVTYLPTTTFL